MNSPRDSATCLVSIESQILSGGPPDARDFAHVAVRSVFMLPTSCRRQGLTEVSVDVLRRDCVHGCGRGGEQPCVQSRRSTLTDPTKPDPCMPVTLAK